MTTSSINKRMILDLEYTGILKYKMDYRGWESGVTKYTKDRTNFLNIQVSLYCLIVYIRWH